jgi:hypothetical protein
MGKQKVRALLKTDSIREETQLILCARGAARTRNHWIRRLQHHFDDPFPIVEHYELIQNYPATPD